MTLEEVAQELDLKLLEALDRVVNKRELLIRLLKVYVSGEYMDCAREALMQKDYKTVETNVHTMKGSGASLGLDIMADACHQVVAAIRSENYDAVEGLFAEADKLYLHIQKVIGELEG